MGRKSRRHKQTPPESKRCETRRGPDTVQGTGALPASLAISDGPTYDYGNVTAGGNAIKTFTVTNSGGVAASSLADAAGLAAPFTYVGGSFPGTTGTCIATLGAGASCTIRLQFSPVAAGAFIDTVDLSYFDGAVAQNTTRNLQGTGCIRAVVPTRRIWARGTGSNGGGKAGGDQPRGRPDGTDRGRARGLLRHIGATRGVRTSHRADP